MVFIQVLDASKQGEHANLTQNLLFLAQDLNSKVSALVNEFENVDKPEAAQYLEVRDDLKPTKSIFQQLSFHLAISASNAFESTLFTSKWIR